MVVTGVDSEVRPGLKLQPYHELTETSHNLSVPQFLIYKIWILKRLD